MNDQINEYIYQSTNCLTTVHVCAINFSEHVTNSRLHLNTSYLAKTSTVSS